MNTANDKNSIDYSKNPFLPFNLLRQYINALIVNVQPENLPEKMNLIFDSGAVNGLIGIGAALYIHHLEELKYIKVNKISGCSVGSLIAVWYICGCPDSMYSDIETLFAHYKTHKNFFIFKQIVSKVIPELFPQEKDIERLNGVLYINYYDTKKHKQYIISKFKDRAHLTTCILRSSHVPFITNPCHKLEDRYVDGIAPYIFSDDKQSNDKQSNDKQSNDKQSNDKQSNDKQSNDKQSNIKNLFIQLINFTSPLKSMNIKNDNNIYPRLIRGMVDTNEFFINGSSPICSYVNWKTKINLYARKNVVYMFLFIIDIFILLRNIIPSYLKETDLYRKLVSLCRLVWIQLFKQLT